MATGYAASKPIGSRAVGPFTWQLCALLASFLVGALWFAKHAEVTAQETVKTVAKSVEKTAIQSAQTTAKETAKTVVAPVVKRVENKQSQNAATLKSLQSQLDHANVMLRMCREDQQKVSDRSEALSKELANFRAYKYKQDVGRDLDIAKLRL